MARSHALVGSEKHVIVPFSSEMTVVLGHRNELLLLSESLNGPQSHHFRPQSCPGVVRGGEVTR